jgi:hypothetical protein
VNEEPITGERIRLPRPRVGVAVLGLTLLSSFASASEYCTKEQYQHDHELIENATKSGTLVEGPKGLRDSILVQEGMWFGMNYPQQIAFMQSFECSVAGLSGKHLLVMDVRSLATGRLLATWFAGTLKPTEAPPTRESQAPTNSGAPEGAEDENPVGLTGEARSNFIKATMDECNRRSNSPQPTYCSCFANDMADNVSIKELKEISAPGNQQAGMIALRPKIEAAAKRCVSPRVPQ